MYSINKIKNNDKFIYDINFKYEISNYLKVGESWHIIKNYKKFNNILASKNLKNNLNIGYTNDFNKFFSFFEKVNIKKLKNKKWYIISNNNRYLIIFQIILNSLILYCFIVMSYYLSFYYYYNYLIILYFNILVEIVFIVDLILNFFVIYRDNNNIMVIELKLIIKNYLTYWFIIDFLSSIPFSIIFLNKYYKILNYFKLLKIFKFKKNLAKVINKYFNNNPFLENIVIYLTLVLIIFHIITCLYYLINNINFINYEIHQFGKEKYEIYIESFYWTVQTVFNVGYGDSFYDIDGKIKILFNIIIMYLGVLVYSIILKIVNKFNKIDFSKNEDYLKILKTFNKFKSKYNISKNLVKTINNKVRTSIFENLKYEFLVNKLSKRLTNDLKNELICKKYNNLLFIKNKSLEFRVEFCKLLSYKIYRGNEIIYKKDDNIEYIYFIISGSVKLYLFDEYKNDYIFLIHYMKNSYFGELENFFLKTKIYRKTKAICYEKTIIYKIKIDEFLNLYHSNYKELKKEFQLNTNYIYNIIKKKISKTIISFGISMPKINKCINLSNIISKVKKPINSINFKYYYLELKSTKNLLKNSINFKNRINQYLMINPVNQNIYRKMKKKVLTRKKVKFNNHNLKRNMNRNSELIIDYKTKKDILYIKKLTKFSKNIPEKFLIYNN